MEMMRSKMCVSMVLERLIVRCVCIYNFVAYNIVDASDVEC